MFDWKKLITKINMLFMKLEFNAERQQEILGLVGELLDYGVPLKRILSTNLAKIYTKGATRVVIKNMADGLARGDSLSSSMEGWFSPMMIMLVSAGEEGNYLSKSLLQASKQLTQKNRAMVAVMSALAYPTTVFIGTTSLLALFRLIVMPKFFEFMQHTTLPPITNAFMVYSNIYTKGWPLWLILIIAMTVGLKPLLNRYVGSYRSRLDHWPIFNVYRQLVAAQWMQTLGELNQHGILMVEAIRFVKFHAPPYLKMHCFRVEKNLRDGRLSMGSVLNTGLIDDDQISILQVVSEIGQLEYRMLDIGNKAYDRALKKITSACKKIGYLFLLLGAFNLIFSILTLYVTGSSMAS